MKILIDEELEYNGNSILDPARLELMEESARICLEGEGITGSGQDVTVISVAFVSEEEIRDINSRFRDVDEGTDVLSFPMYGSVDELKKATDTQQEVLLGDVIICTDRVMKQAEEYGHSVTRELIYLFVHSVLHLLGHDHMEEDDRAAMREIERKIMEMIGVGR